MSKHNKDDSESSIENILFDERLDQDPLFDEPEAFEAAHVQTLKDKLLHFSRFGNLLTLILGESGVGKTYLLEQFIDSMDDNVFVCHIEAQPLYSVEQLYQDICTSVSTEELYDYPTDVDSFREWLDEIALMNECHIVAIDDAETLSQELLLEISRLSAYQQTLDVPKIQFMLFATHDLTASMDTVSNEILDDSGVYVIDLPLLDDSDAKNWLKYCLHKAGYLASDDELEELLADSDGNLANLAAMAESYADEQLEEEHIDIEEEPEETVSMMGFWFGGLTIVVLAVLALFFYQKEISQWLFPEKAPVVVTTEQPVSVSTEAEVTDEQVADAVQEDTVVEEKVAEETLDAQAEDLTSEELVNNDSVNDAVTEMETSQDQSDSSVTSQDDNDAPSETTSEVTPEATTDNSTINEPETSAPDSDALVTEPAYTPAEQALMAMDDSNYVVQIIGLSNPNSIAKILAENDSLDLVAYRSLLNGKPWQIIVLSGFTTYQQAQQARLDLPESLTEFKPWIKSQAKVKEEIRAAVTN